MNVRAAYYERFGAAADVLQVGEKTLLPPTQGEVQVQIHASSVNPSDVKKRAGLRGDFAHTFVIPHSDGAGVITAVGEGVSNDKIGQRVWLYEAQHNRTWGTVAQYINLPAQKAVPLPDMIGFAEGAAIGIPMMTAHRCLTYDSIEGKTVLITGGQGRVGYYAIQLAKLFGADVVSTVSNDEGIDELLELGADVVVNYKNRDYSLEIEGARPGGIDLVVDVEFGGNFKTYLPLLKNNSVIASYASSHNPTPELPFYDLMFKNIFLHPILVYSMPEKAKQEAIKDINRSLEQGKIKHRIAKEFKLENIVEAHQTVENSSVRGSVIVALGNKSDR